MWISIELIIALILMPIIIKWEDWGWWSCLVFIGLCMMLTPIGGIFVYKFILRG